MEESIKVKKETFSLPNKKVLVKPIVRSGRWLPSSHSGAFMYDNTSRSLTVPLDSKTGSLKDPLTLAEREFFENRHKSGLDFTPGDLSVHKKEDNFWESFSVLLRKNESVVSDQSVLLVLNLADSMDYLRYKLLLANAGSGGEVAPSWEDRFNIATYKVALVEEGHEEEVRTRRADNLEKVNKFFYQINESKSKLRDLLTIYWLENKTNKRPPENASIDWYKAEVQNLIDTDLDAMLRIVDDKDNYEYKVLVNKAVTLSILEYNSELGYTLSDGTPMGETLKSAIRFLKDPKNQEKYLRLKTQVSNT